MRAEPSKGSGKDYYSHNPHNYVRGPTLWLPHVPESDPHKIEPKKKWYQGNETKSFWVGLLGTVAAIFVTVIYYFQLREMVKTTNSAQDQLAEMHSEHMFSERAWVGPYQAGVATNGPNVFITCFKNYGKTPAVHVTGAMGITTVSNLCYSMDKQVGIANQISDAILFPDTQTDIIEMCPWVRDALADGVPVYLYGKMWYDDTFGRHHWTTFCYRFNGWGWGPNERFTTTNFHNAADDGQDGKNPN